MLIGAALLFWGWQTGYLAVGLILAVVLEGARVIKARWEFSDQDFTRIWTFCTLVFLAAAIYSFTNNQGPSGYRGFFENPNFFTQRDASAATARTAASLVRWLPMVFCLFIAAQIYSSREGIPPETISMILRWRWKRAQKAGKALPPSRSVDVSYPYFALCLFASSVHPGEDNSFFWGLCVLLSWALWPQRSKRFSIAVWAATIVMVIALGYTGQKGLSRVQGYIANLNPQWLFGYGHRHFDPAQSHTDLGSISRLKISGTIVVRLETKDAPVPGLLREASYRTFKGRTWYAEADKDFFYISDTNNSSIYVLVPGKTNMSSANIGCYLDGGESLLPLPSGSGLLKNLSAYQVSKNSLGAVLAQGPGLVVFDAFYGPGATLDSAPKLPEDIQVTPLEKKVIHEVALQLGLREGESAEEAVQTLRRFFLNKFTYSTWQKPQRRRFGKPGETETPLANFLLHTHSGHCEYFATAGVLLLREIKIPARYAVGYAVHEGGSGKYVVRQRDAHAWCLVWHERSQTWVDLDLTPGTWIAMEEERAAPLQSLLDGWSWLGFEFSKLRWGQNHWRRYLMWALLPTLALLLYRIIFQTRRRHRRQESKPTPALFWPGLDSEFYELEPKLAARGLARHTSEPLSDWLQRALQDPALIDLNGPLRDLLNLHYRYRFDPQGLSAEEREELRREARSCLERVDQVRIAQAVPSS